jgi:hypothetical protein
MNQFPPSPRVSHLDRLKFFRKFAEIFASQGAPPVSMTPLANLLPVSLVLLTPVTNLPPVTTIPAANLPPVSTTPASLTQVAKNVTNIRLLKKFATALMVNSGAWGKLIQEKKTEVENLVTLSL